MAKKRISKKIKKIYKSQNQNSSSPIIQGITYSNIKFIKNNHKNIIIYLNLIQNKKYILAASEYKITLHDSKTYNKLSENNTPTRAKAILAIKANIIDVCTTS